MKYKNHIPEGTQDILFDKYVLKSSLETSLIKLFSSYGYAGIETPMFEYYDVFAQGKDSIATEAMYKFYDSKGRILVLRPDMTVPVARVAGTKLLDGTHQPPLRISYSGRVFRYNAEGFGGQKDILQSGIELLGVKSPEADAEVIAIAANALVEAGLENFKIDIGQIDFFMGLMNEGRFSESEIEVIRELIDIKDMSGIEQILKEHELDEKLRETIMNLPNYFGDANMVRQLEQSGLNESSKKALEYLENVIELLRDYGIEKYITIDLGMVQRLNYYTGIIFKGFTGGVGFPVLSGGRYDNLVGKYGNPCNAVGFSVNLSMVMEALQKQNLRVSKFGIDFIIGYAKAFQGKAFLLAKQLRRSGKTIELDIENKTFEELKILSTNRPAARILFLADDTKLDLFNTFTRTTESITVQTLLLDSDTAALAPPPIH